MGSSKAYWFVPNHIIYVHNVGDLTSQDFRDVDKQIVAFMREARGHDHKVHVLVDSLELTKLPPLLELDGGRILSYMREPNVGWTVVVGMQGNAMLVILSRLLTSMSHVKLQMLHDVARGVSFLKNTDPQIPDAPDIEMWQQANLSETTPR